MSVDRTCSRRQCTRDLQQLQEVRVGPREIGVHAHQHHASPRVAARPSVRQPVGQRRQRDQLAAQVHDRRPHAPEQREAACDLGARGRSRRSAPGAAAPQSSRAVRPLRVTATIASAWPRHASVTAACATAPPRAPRDPRAPPGTGAAGSGPASASSMIASQRPHDPRRVRRPTAVSPDSMIASTPSSTAWAASLTSARVGRGCGPHRVEHLGRHDHRQRRAPAPPRRLASGPAAPARAAPRGPGRRARS